jgi:hypothetical protein
MPVTNHPAQTRSGLQIGVLGEELGDFGFNRLRQQRARRCAAPRSAGRQTTLVEAA